MAPSAQRLTDLFDAAVPGALTVSAPPASVAGSLFFPGWDAGNECRDQLSLSKTCTNTRCHDRRYCKH